MDIWLAREAVARAIDPLLDPFLSWLVGLSLWGILPMTGLGLVWSVWRTKKLPGLGSILFTVALLLLLFNVVHPFSRLWRHQRNIYASREMDYERSCRHHHPQTHPLHDSCGETLLDIQEEPFLLAVREARKEADKWIKEVTSSIAFFFTFVAVATIGAVFTLAWCYMRFDQHRVMQYHALWEKKRETLADSIM